MYSFALVVGIFTTLAFSMLFYAALTACEYSRWKLLLLILGEVAFVFAIFFQSDLLLHQFFGISYG